MKNEIDVVKKYVPKLLFCKNEPFLPKAIFYKIYENDKEYKVHKSFSSKYQLLFEKDNQFAIEYAIYYSYDIQHLYDLEHVFVYVNEDFSIGKVISSFHGKFFNSKLNNIDTEIDSKIIKLYVQPGKHALMPNPILFELFDGYENCCNLRAGVDGFLIKEDFLNYYKKDINFDLKVINYIKNNFSFCPINIFETKVDEGAILQSNDKFIDFIVNDLNNEISLIK